LFPFIYYLINYFIKFLYLYDVDFNNYNTSWGLGIGDWGLGIGDWAQSPIPNPPIPNPQSPKLEILKYIK
jgi:hypothetical protein